MNKSVLFLDDNPDRHRKFRSECPFADRVETAQECIDRLRINKYDVVFLDHDLGGQHFQDPNEANSGSGVVRWIARHKPTIGRVIVHSLNPGERRNMTMDLRRLGYNAQECPFTNLINTGLVEQLTSDVDADS